MFRKKTFILAIVPLFLCKAMYCKNPSEHITKKNFRSMETQMQKMKTNIDKMFDDKWFNKKNKSQNSFSFSQKDNTVILQFTVDPDIEKFNAVLDKSCLTISIPKKNQLITIEYDKENNYLSFTTEEIAQKETTEKNSYQKYTSHSETRKGMTIDNILDFKKANIEYENNILSVIIPKQIIKKKDTKKLNVLIK